MRIPGSALLHAGVPRAIRSPAADVRPSSVGLDPRSPLAAAVAAALERESELDPEERRRALGRPRVVSRVRDLLEWIGSGRTITETGALRRADIADVAALLDVAARGDRTSGRDGDVLRVTSMWEIPVLSAWWEALRTADLIETTPTRVRPGAAARAWLGAESPSVEGAGEVVSLVTAQLLTGSLSGDDEMWDPMFANLILDTAVAALGPVADLAPPADRETPLMLTSVQEPLHHLVHAGVVVRESGGEFRVPELLGGAYARGLLLAESIVATLGRGPDDEMMTTSSGIPAGRPSCTSPEWRLSC